METQEKKLWCTVSILPSEQLPMEIFESKADAYTFKSEHPLGKYMSVIRYNRVEGETYSKYSDEDD
jgi:hypothetical protein